MLKNITSDGTTDLKDYNTINALTAYVSGTFDGATIEIQGKSTHSDKNYVTLGDEAIFTEDGYATIDIYGKHNLRVKTSGTTSNTDVDVVIDTKYENA